METGKKVKTSPIIKVLRSIEARSTLEVRVHFSRRRMEKNIADNARKVFFQFGMEKTRSRNGVLLYINPFRREFAFVPDRGIWEKTRKHYWDGLSRLLKQDLLETEMDHAISIALRTVEATGLLHFPREKN